MVFNRLASIETFVLLSLEARTKAGVSSDRVCHDYLVFPRRRVARVAMTLCSIWLPRRRERLGHSLGQSATLGLEYLSSTGLCTREPKIAYDSSARTPAAVPECESERRRAEERTVRRASRLRQMPPTA